MTDRNPRTIHTVGHSSHSTEAFIALLRSHGIAVVVDVRRYPGSKRHPEFGRERLSRDLAGAGIRYLWLGDRLGGLRDGGYEAHMKSTGFRAGIEALEAAAAEEPAALMCAERDPARCHRIHIAGALVRRGWRVMHITGPDRAEAHELQEGLFE